MPLIVALLLCASALFLDFYNDDWLVRWVVRGHAPGSDPHPLRLFEFMSSEPQVRAYIREGMLPWWTDPQLKIRFLRPLSSLLMWVDHRVLVTPLLGHLHSLLWFVLHLLVARRVIDRVLPPRGARWAFWTLCLAGYHAGTVLWISARNGLSASTVALLALLTHLDDRLDERPVRSLRRGARRGLAAGARPGGRGHPRREAARARRHRRGAGDGGPRRPGHAAEEALASRAARHRHGARGALPTGPGSDAVQGIDGRAVDRAAARGRLPRRRRPRADRGRRPGGGHRGGGRGERVAGVSRALSMEPVDHVVTRLSEQTIEVRPVTGALASSFFARVYRRSATAFREGERIDTVDARYVVGDVVGGRPRRVEVTFARPFEGRGTCLLRWRAGGLERFDPPPVGASVTLRHEPGPFGM